MPNSAVDEEEEVTRVKQFIDRQTNKRTPDKTKSESLTLAFSSGELKTRNVLQN